MHLALKVPELPFSSLGFTGHVSVLGPQTGTCEDMSYPGLMLICRWTALPPSPAR